MSKSLFPSPFQRRRSSSAFSQHSTSERSPLLSFPNPATVNDAASTPKRPTASSLHNRVVIILVLLVIAIDLPAYFQSVPRVRLLEGIYCKNYYLEHDPSVIGPGGMVPEAYCKLNSIQKELALLRGWLTFFDYAPGIFLAIPFGILADKYGRRWLIIVNIISFLLRVSWIYFVLSVPHLLSLRWIWFEAAFQLFGGGSMVATSLIFVILNDVTPQAKLANMFFLIGGVNMACLVIVPPISAKLMEIDVWVPTTLGLCLQFISPPLVLLLPETLNVEKDFDPVLEPSNDPVTHPEHAEHHYSTSSEAIFSSNASTASSSSFFASKAHSTWQNILHNLKTLARNSSFVIRDWRVLFLMSTYPLRMATNVMDDLLIQYIPKRWGWSMASTNYVWSYQSLCSMIVMLVLLPWISNILLRKNAEEAATTTTTTTVEGDILPSSSSSSTAKTKESTTTTPPATKKDILFIRVCAIFAAASYLIISLAPNIPLLLLGITINVLSSGMGGSTRALLTSYVRPNEVARLYTGLAIVETASIMLAGPIFATIFNEGLELGGVWMGLPWFVMGVGLSVVAAAVWLVRLEDGGMGRGEDGVRGWGEVGREEGLERAGEGVGTAGGIGSEDGFAAGEGVRQDHVGEGEEVGGSVFIEESERRS